MFRSDFKLIVKKVLEDYDLDDRSLAVDEFIEDLILTIEYESDLEFEEDPDEEAEYSEED